MYYPNHASDESEQIGTTSNAYLGRRSAFARGGVALGEVLMILQFVRHLAFFAPLLYNILRRSI